MMDRFEQQLKDALRREEPPLGFAARVTAQARGQEQKSWWSRLFAMRLRWATALVVCVVMLGGILVQRERERERAEGEAAKQQVRLALQIAGSKVRLAQNMVQRINEKSPEDEQ
jgi:uncharacterized protein YpmS